MDGREEAYVRILPPAQVFGEASRLDHLQDLAVAYRMVSGVEGLSEVAGAGLKISLSFFIPEKF